MLFNKTFPLAGSIILWQDVSLYDGFYASFIPLADVIVAC
jgi:hypothetical protein